MRRMQEIGAQEEGSVQQLRKWQEGECTCARNARGKRGNANLRRAGRKKGQGEECKT
jgi:hypothetical protein